MFLNNLSKYTASNLTHINVDKVRRHEITLYVRMEWFQKCIDNNIYFLITHNYIHIYIIKNADGLLQPLEKNIKFLI